MWSYVHLFAIECAPAVNIPFSLFVLLFLYTIIMNYNHRMYQWSFNITPVCQLLSTCMCLSIWHTAYTVRVSYYYVIYYIRMHSYMNNYAWTMHLRACCPHAYDLHLLDQSMQRYVYMMIYYLYNIMPIYYIFILFNKTASTRSISGLTGLESGHLAIIYIVIVHVRTLVDCAMDYIIIIIKALYLIHA